MKYIALLAMLLSFPIQANTPDNCIKMARDYLLSIDQAQPEILTNSKREVFLESCQADAAGFNQALMQLVMEDSVVHAIYDNQKIDQLDKHLLKI